MGLLGCQNSLIEINQLTSGTKQSLVCQQNFDDFNNSIYEFWLNKKNPPSTPEFKDYLKESLLADPQWSKVNEATLEQVLAASTDYYDYITNNLTVSAQDTDDKLKLLTALEIGDRQEGRAQLQVQWAAQKANLSQKLQRLQLPCPPTLESTQPSKPASDDTNQKELPLTTGLPRAVEGLRRAFATAYQSCQALTVPALDATTPDLEGIRILKKSHPDGVGRQRVYGDVQKILTTHPYYQPNAEQTASKCFDARKTPLIYDYGGKPKTSADANSLLDFFSNDGSGTSVLGIDCSGFIFSAIARGGLNIAPNKALKAVSVHGISASMFKDPVNNGLTCFAPMTFTATNDLRAGDIIAAKGHVIMVDQIGTDPLGLRRAQSAADCNDKILTPQGFDFVLTHSSPWKEGVGINRSQAKDYIPTYETFAVGLTKYAVALCQSRFQGFTQAAMPIPEISVVRHKGTPECLTTKPIGLRYEGCISQCSFTDAIETI